MLYNEKMNEFQQHLKSELFVQCRPSLLYFELEKKNDQFYQTKMNENKNQTVITKSIINIIHVK